MMATMRLVPRCLARLGNIGVSQSRLRRGSVWSDLEVASNRDVSCGSCRPFFGPSIN